MRDPRLVARSMLSVWCNLGSPVGPIFNRLSQSYMLCPHMYVQMSLYVTVCSCVVKGKRHMMGDLHFTCMFFLLFLCIRSINVL